MKLFYLGLLIVIMIIMISINMSRVEGFDYEGRKEEQRGFLKETDKYWGSRLFPQVIKDVDKESKFLELSKDKTKLNKISPTGTVGKSKLVDKIEKCNLINITGNCGEIEENGCGYCWDTNKIIYGDATGPATDVCSKKNWIAPGPGAGYNCQKKKDQEICKKMTDCGDTAGDRSICAWCPLKGTGVPKKPGLNGGWVAKYPEDKCDWQSQLEGESAKKISFLGWSPSKGGYPRRGKSNADGSMTPAPSPYGAPLDRGEGDCDADSDCGPGMKCGHDGRGPDGKSGVPGLKNPDGSALTPNAGYKDYCYDPNAAPKFEGNLISPVDCARFKQLFPCVGPTMLSGPHTSECLQSLWKKSGCVGDLKTQVSDRTDYSNWNSVGYSQVQDNMKKDIYEKAKNGTDYTKASQRYKQCFNEDINPCEKRFKPRPDSCVQKIYDSTGCSASGKLNPTNTLSWPNGYVDDMWKKGQQGGWSVNTYKSKLFNIKRQMQSGLLNPKTDFDNTINTSMMCNGKMPEIPWDKPCWRDFTIILSTIPGVTENPTNLNLSFNGSSASFKSLLTVGGRGSWKNEFVWVGKYEITKSKYDGKYFPFWNFIRESRNYWNNNWDIFKTRLLTVPSVSSGTTSVNSKWGGWSNPGWLKRPKGQGDCDSDANCGPGLKCSQNPKKLPGVVDGGAIKPNNWGAGRDFCYDPNDAAFNGGGEDMLAFLDRSRFDDFIQTTTSASTANSKGYFLKVGLKKYVSKQAFMNENFPYWLFLRTASVN